MRQSSPKLHRKGRPGAPGFAVNQCMEVRGPLCRVAPEASLLSDSALQTLACEPLIMCSSHTSLKANVRQVATAALEEAQKGWERLVLVMGTNQCLRSCHQKADTFQGVPFLKDLRCSLPWMLESSSISSREVKCPAPTL